jgi:outer membrane beta-barrel protein
MRIRTYVLPLLSAALVAAPLTLHAQVQKPAEQVIEPEVDRRDIKLPRFPSKDFEIGVFAGTYATQNFGASAVVGLKAGYHITEDIFVEAAFGQTKVNDEAFRQILPGGVFVNQTEKLSYYNLSAGYNILPGEIFIGRNTAKASQFYLIGGVGSTKFVDQKRQTVNLGFGMRVYFTDKMAVQVDMRDHIFSLDLLGKRQNTQNLELTAGFTYFF